MTFPANTRIARYEIVALVGAGGMGEVYRARDPHLGRDVAVKVLPAAFSADPERLSRFEQEAQAAGALNHPNILSIHDKKLMAVPVTPAVSFEAGVHVALFATRVPTTGHTDDRNNYVPAADGQRFLINSLVEDGTTQPITLVLNWAAGLKSGLKR